MKFLCKLDGHTPISTIVLEHDIDKVATLLCLAS